MKRWYYNILLFVAFIIFYTPISAQIILEHDSYVDLEGVEPFKIDTSLFRLFGDEFSNLYDDINRYNTTPISTQRYGLSREVYNHLLGDETSAKQSFITPLEGGSISLFSSTSNYRGGLCSNFYKSLGGGWELATSLYFRSGRDPNVEGVFQHTLSPKATLSLDLGDNHYLIFSLCTPYQMRGLKSSATSECYELTNNKLYNPSWGLYHGEVRNSRVLRNLYPSLDIRYQRAISNSTTAALELHGQYSLRKISRLGWYDGYNPSPNYYSKLPSYYEGTSSYSTMLEVWEQNNLDYTQIAWDNLEEINRSSTNGESHYVVENSVERGCDIDINLLFNTTFFHKLDLEYGLVHKITNHREYKELSDLLGGDYLLDIDQYAGDFIQVGNELQNNLREPNRVIKEGDRFGYDFSLCGSSTCGVVDIKYNSARFDYSLYTSFGEESFYRHGYYEKERFSGSGSYGDSPTITLPIYRFEPSIGYALAKKHYLKISALIDSQAPDYSDLFVVDDYSNKIIDSPKSQRLNSTTISYSFSTPSIKLLARGYIISQKDMCEVWSGYDDLSSTYCNIVISNLDSRSLGLETSVEYSALRNLTLNSTFSVGSYRYTSSPEVKLYDDTDLSVVSSSLSSSLKGYIVGNSPQLIASFGGRYYLRGVSLSATLYYYAQRYISPSIIRRTDRIINSATSSEMLSSLLDQERLPDIFSLNISFSKRFTINGDKRLLLVAQLQNLLCEKEVIYSAREANRILKNSVDGLTYNYSPQSSTYNYSVGREFNISLKYNF